jgi:hypothetical protein
MQIFIQGNLQTKINSQDKLQIFRFCSFKVLLIYALTRGQATPYFKYMKFGTRKLFHFWTN